ncbi:MAG: hypothetical protein Q9159_003583 [Coniocarpon cinnabarinum]
MPDPEIQDPPPPTYEQATGSSNAPNRLQVPNARNNIPPDARRSMEDEGRELPEGWIRRFDEGHAHQFFVDTRAEPPRSIWHHPYDDEQYLSTLSSEERERLQEQARVPNKRDTEAMSTDGEDAGDESPDAYQKMPKISSPQQPDAASGEGSSSQLPQQKRPFGRKLKDKITGTTHEQRVQDREQRAKEEERQYQEYMAMRTAMRRAIQTGEPQFVGRDRDGKDVYIEPPTPPGAYRGYAVQSGRYVNPYSQGPYTNPNARFLRPGNPYSRPYGPGYGGGIGLPLAGGVAGGLLLGGALGGFGL